MFGVCKSLLDFVVSLAVVQEVEALRLIDVISMGDVSHNIFFLFL